MLLQLLRTSYSLLCSVSTIHDVCNLACLVGWSRIISTWTL